MKICLVPGRAHPRNIAGFSLLVAHAEAIGAWELVPDSGQADIVWSPERNTPFSHAFCVLYGPYSSVLPDERYFSIPSRPGAVYIQPSEWARNLWKEAGDTHVPGIPVVVLPFPVDVDRFCPPAEVQASRAGCMLCSKARSPEDVAFALSTLRAAGHDPVAVAHEDLHTEQEYVAALRTCAFVVWVGSHESQAFALEEALSMNIPILVWSTLHLSEEYNCLEAYRAMQTPVSSAPYFSGECGQIVYSRQELADALPVFAARLGEFSPRAYVLRELSPAAVYTKYWQPVIEQALAAAPARKLVSATLMGGLGNQLFQMAAAFGTAARLGRDSVIHEPSITPYITAHTQERYVDTIFASWRRTNGPCDGRHAQEFHDSFVHTPVPNSGAAHINLFGYYQNEQFIKDMLPEFVAKLALPEDVAALPNTCFIHVRQGDYVGHWLHDVNLYGWYLTEAMRIQRELRPGVQFVVFTDGPAACHALPQLQAPDVHFTEESNEVRALVQMTKCEAGGICWNSSYSWWGAYLNRSPERTIIFPSRWVNNDWKVDIQFKGSIVLKVL